MNLTWELQSVYPRLQFWCHRSPTKGWECTGFTSHKEDTGYWSINQSYALGLN